MINGIPTLAYRGVNAPNPPNFMSINRAPTPNDADFPLGTIWLDESALAVYMLVKFNGTANGVTALWSILASGSMGNVTLIGNTGVANEDVLGNINVIGATPNISTTGDNTNTLIIVLSDDISIDSLSLPDTTASFDEGVINWGGEPFIHNYVNGSTKSNIFIGKSAGNASLTLTGIGNTVLGDQSAQNITDGIGNTFIGAGVANANAITGNVNIGLGSGCLQSLSSGEQNCAIGGIGAIPSLALLTTGSNNIAINGGIDYASTESSNICISNDGVVTESNTIRIGTQGASGGQQNRCFVAGIWNTNISAINQAVLVDANGQLGTGPAGTVTFDNINLPNTNPAVPEGYINFGGDRFIYNLGINNTFIGQNSGNNALTGDDNVALGTNVLEGLTSGSFNTVLGALSATALESGSNNTFVGSLVAQNAVTSGDDNVGIGSPCLSAILSGTGNCILGAGAATSLTDSNFNCALGFNALNSLIDGNGGNIALGQESLSLLENGELNIAIGVQAGSSYTGSESDNICIGNNVNGTIGESGIMRLGKDGVITDTHIAGLTNVELGLSATSGNIQTEDGSVIIGSSSNNADSNAAIFLKNRASAAVQTGDSLGFIDFRGYDGTNYVRSASIGSIVTGTVAADQVGGSLYFYTTPAIPATPPEIRMVIDETGEVAIATGGALRSISTYAQSIGGTNQQLLIDDTGLIGTILSSRRYKDTIEDMGDRTSPIMQLRPVTFTMKDDESKQLRYGLIAEEVEQVMPDIVGYHKNGEPDYVRYHDLPCMLLNELQKQQRVIADLLNRVKILEDTNSIN